jgi:hypothetical protein
MSVAMRDAMAASPAAETEIENPLNRLLDAFEEQIKALIAAGLEPQLRARLTRLLPVPTSPPAGASGRLRGAGSDAPRDFEDELDLAMVVTVTKRLSRYRLAAAEHEALRRLHDWALGEIGGRQPASGSREDGTRGQDATAASCQASPTGRDPAGSMFGGASDSRSASRPYAREGRR